MIFGRKRPHKENLPGRIDAVDEIDVSDEELEDAVAAANPYYAKVSSVYSAARYILFVFLVLLISISAIKNPESITYDNLMFLMKDLGSVAESSGGNFETITYNPDTTLSFSGFRKNLAVATPSGLKIYEGDGDLSFEGSDRFSNPLIQTSDRYLLVYDFGGSSFALYNSFARIYSEKLDYDITGADISDSGMFAVVSRTKEYNSAVLLYTKNCKLKNRYLSSDRVIDISLNDSGTRVCILSFTATNASFKTKIMITKPREDTPMTSLELEDVFPLSCNYTSDGNLTVLCDKALYFYDGDGNLKGSCDLEGEPEAVCLCDEASVISFSEASVAAGSYIMVFDSEGDTVYSGDADRMTADVGYAEGYLFSLSGNILTRTDIRNDEKVSKEVSGSGKKMIVYSKDDVMICSSSSAEYYDFSE